jgi:DNA-binding response OmpR family regulator
MGKTKLLLIDDDLALGGMLKLKIEKTGDYDVTYSPDGDRIVELAREVKPDLVILDIDMPGTDGGDARTLLRKNPDTEGIPVLFLSSLVTNEDVAASDGVIGHQHMASKQATIGELIDRIQALL